MISFEESVTRPAGIVGMNMSFRVFNTVVVKIGQSSGGEGASTGCPLPSQL